MQSLKEFKYRSSSACKIDYLSKSCRLQFCNTKFDHMHKFQNTLYCSKGAFRTPKAPVLGFFVKLVSG